VGSVRRRGRKVRVELDPAEVVLLASLVGQVRQILTDGLPEGSADSEDPLQALLGVRSSESAVSEDPILARLLPDAYRDDDEAASEYRRLMDTDLRLQKSAALQRVLDGLAGGGTHRGGELRIELVEDDAAQWLYALTDLRLALGTTLGVSEDIDAEIAARQVDSERGAGLAVYDWLTWLQDATVRAVSGD
jgi:Domain of unknown function (DUF2017)